MRLHSDAPHPGIRLDKIPAKGWAGLLFTLAAMAIFLIRVPETRWFLALAVPAGIVIALVLRLGNRVWAGIVLALAAGAVGIVEIPPLRWCLVLVVPPGVVIGLILYLTNRSSGNKPS